MSKIANIRTALESQAATAIIGVSYVTYGKAEGDSLEPQAEPSPPQINANVIFEREEYDYVSTGPSRSVDVVSIWQIQYAAKESGATYVALDAIMDLIAERAFTALTDRTLGGHVHDAQVTDIEYEYSSEGDQKFGAVRVSYRINYTITTSD